MKIIWSDFDKAEIWRHLNINKRASLASAVQLADTLGPLEAYFRHLGSHELIIGR